ncbi:MAG TPA: hypothetical protein PKB13_11505 [Clostridia bacterium]|nr:hypothetical protein [Clostridia bacterium]
MVSEKIKALLALKGKKNVGLAAHLGLSPQSMNNKLSRGSWSAEDLIKVAEFTGCTLSFDAGENQRIVLDIGDIRND